MNVGVDGPVEEYLAGVRAALADLPATEVGEILDDVRGHLADLRAEVGHDAGAAALTARLGTPEVYAAELRAAAGYPAPPVADARRGSTAAVLALGALVASTLLVVVGVVGVVAVGDPTVVLGALALAVLVQLAALPALVGGGPRMAAVAALPAVRAATSALPVTRAAGSPPPPPRGVTGFVVSLQPAWWVVRALVAAALAAMVLGGQPVAWLVLVVLLVPLSVALGHLTRRDRRWLWPVVPLNALAALLLPLLVALLGPAAAPYGAGYEAPAAYPPGLWQDGERQITDVRPVDATGQPLTGVYLFDQDGRPIDTGDPCDGYGAASTEPYPRGSAEYDEAGECAPAPPAPLVVAVPTPSPTPAPPPVPTTAPPAPAPPATAEPVPSPAPPTG